MRRVSLAAALHERRGTPLRRPPYLTHGPVFASLQDPDVFVEAGSVEWPGGAGLSFDKLYLESESASEA